MKAMKKAVLAVLIFALVVAVCACAFGDSKKNGEKAALKAALEDAGFIPDEVTDIDIEYEKTPSSAWYEVDFESGRTDYEYRIDAYTGEILSATTD